MTTQQISELQEKAYRAGMMAAWDHRVPCEIPIKYSSHIAGAAYVDGFTAEREAMANKVASSKLCKLRLLPARESDKFTKAADCIG